MLPLVALAAAESEPAPPTDVPTVLAIGAAVYVEGSLVHEAFGHPIGCLAQGGRVLGFSTSVAGCDPDGPFERAGGATANLLTGGAFAAHLYLDPPDAGAAYYFEWLSASVNLFQAGGYLMVGPWIPVGDFGTGGVLAGVDDPLPYQLALSGAGVAMTFGSLFLVNDLAEPLLGAEPSFRKRRQLLLTVPAYLLGSGLITGSALLNRLDPRFAVSAAAANFAGTLFIAYMPLFFASDVFYPSRADSPAEPLAIRRSVPWIIAGSAIALTTVAVLGPGVGDFPEPHPLFPGL